VATAKPRVGSTRGFAGAHLSVEQAVEEQADAIPHAAEDTTLVDGIQGDQVGTVYHFIVQLHFDLADHVALGDWRNQVRVHGHAGRELFQLAFRHGQGQVFSQAGLDLRGRAFPYRRGRQFSTLLIEGLGFEEAETVSQQLLSFSSTCQQLSFALTFCLLFTQKLNFWQVNLLLSVVSFPLIVVQQYHWHLLQTCANFAAIPVFGTLIVPCVMIGYFGQSVTGVVYWMNATIASFAKTLDWLATWPGDLIVGKIPWLFVLLLLIAGLLCFVREKKVALYSRVLWPTIFAITLIWTHFPVHGELTTFDIGQGDAALIRTPFNRTVTLIDTGGKVTFGQQKNWQKQRFTQTNGEAVIVNYLHSCGISRVDHLVLTHQDFDHIGDAKIILQKMSVKYVILPAGMMKKEAYMREIQPYLKKAQVIEAIAGTKVPKLPLQILHPFVAGEADNENSIALFGKIGGKQLFTAGDLDQDGEVAIANRYPNLVVDLIKFGHHGSKTSTNPEIMKRWHPQIGIVSAGRHNRYNHPSEETLKTAQDNQILVYNTQAHGMIKYSYFREKGHFKVKLTDEFTTTTAEH